MSCQVAVSPVGFAHDRLHFRYFQQLVDECKQVVAVVLDRFSYAACLIIRSRPLEVSAQSEYHGEGCAKLMGDVGEKRFTHTAQPLHSPLVASLYTHHVVHLCQSHHEYHDDECKYEEEHPLAGTLGLIFMFGFVHLLHLSVALNAQTDILNLVYLLDVHHAVLQHCGLLVVEQGQPEVALSFVNEVIEFEYLGLIFHRFDVPGFGQGLFEYG